MAIGPTLPAGAAFERPPLTPEAEALGGVLAAGTDGVWGNPAGPALPARSPRLLVRSDAARPFDLPELSEIQAALCVGRDHGAAGLGVRRFGSQLYGEKEVRFVLSGCPVPALALGAAARGLSAGVSPDAFRSFALDVGFLARAESVTVLGALTEAVLGEVPGDPRGERRRTAFGAARRLGRGTVLRVELQRQGRGPLATVLGLSWSPWPPLTLRAGAREDPRTLSWGFSVRRGGICLSGSAAHATLGRTLRVGVRADR